MQSLHIKFIPHHAKPARVDHALYICFCLHPCLSRSSKELGVAHLPIAFQAHGVLVQVALISGALGLSLVPALARRSGLSRRQYVPGYARHTL